MVLFVASRVLRRLSMMCGLAFALACCKPSPSALSDVDREIGISNASGSALAASPHECRAGGSYAISELRRARNSIRYPAARVRRSVEVDIERERQWLRGTFRISTAREAWVDVPRRGALAFESALTIGPKRILH